MDGGTGGTTAQSRFGDYGKSCSKSADCDGGICMLNSDRVGGGVCTMHCDGAGDCPAEALCEPLDDSPNTVCSPKIKCIAADPGVNLACQMIYDQGGAKGPHGLQCKDKQQVPSDCTELDDTDFCCASVH
jgi:hypothetical protein